MQEIKKSAWRDKSSMEDNGMFMMSYWIEDGRNKLLMGSGMSICSPKNDFVLHSWLESLHLLMDFDLYNIEKWHIKLKKKKITEWYVNRIVI